MSSKPSISKPTTKSTAGSNYVYVDISGKDFAKNITDALNKVISVQRKQSSDSAVPTTPNSEDQISKEDQELKKKQSEARDKLVLEQKLKRKQSRYRYYRSLLDRYGYKLHRLEYGSVYIN